MSQGRDAERGTRLVAVAAAWMGSAILALALAAAPAAAKPKKLKPWPPREGKGQLFVHFGEEHINDDDGATLLPKVVMVSSRYRPVLVTMSGDKANDGRPEEFTLWSDVMKRFDLKRIPWFAAVGNHDRKAPPGIPGGVAVNGDFGPYSEFFAGRPYPMGDGPPYGGTIEPSQRDAADPTGASSHYYVDTRTTRWIFIDNSCWSITGCESLQSPSGQNQGGSEPQFEFLRRVATEASNAGRLAFVVMHMPTQDPGDQSYREPTAISHTMGKGVYSVDNSNFEDVAASSGVDGVFVAHIKGQFLYEGEGGVPYFIDGGAGGELYTEGPVGVDHGYWHGFRLVRVRRGELTTDVVPIFVKGGISIDGPKRMRPGETQTFAAFGKQPVFNNAAKVEALELRDPDPVRPGGSSSLAWFGDVARWAGPLLAVAALLPLAIVLTGARRRRLAVPALAAIGLLAVVGVSAAQQSEPTTTPLESLPNPARIWTSSNPEVLKPVASDSDDPRRRKRTQTADGEFRAVCPGRARLTITSGFEKRSIRVKVAGGEAPPRCG
jgi:Calcineurin-like phosphoesterase